MLELKCSVSDTVAEALEMYFLEGDGLMPWSLLRINDKSPYELNGYFNEPSELENAYAQLRAQFGELPENPTISELDDRDWQNAYKAFLTPWNSRGLHWVPVWMREEYTVPAGEVCVWFDAGMAFGTGSHETTRLCAGRLLDYREAVGAEAFSKACIIDAGCGSGILAISATLLGARGVFGFDIDTEAERVSKENAVFNLPNPEAVTFVQAGIPEALKGKAADLLLANIQTDVLIPFCEPLIHGVKRGGVLALSGILARESDTVRNHFLDTSERVLGIRPKADVRIMGEWSDLLLSY